MKRLHFFAVLASILVSLLGMKQAENGNYSSNHSSLPLGEPRRTILNINNFTSWVRCDGKFEGPEGNCNGTFPRGTAGAIFTEGILWGGFVRDGQTPVLRVNGSTYNTGLVAGAILGICTGAIEHPSDRNVRIWRVRRDWQTADLSQDTSETHMPEEEIRHQYEIDWNEWPATKGAPYEDVDNNRQYDPSVDIPGIPGADQTIWFVANDIGSLVQLAGSPPIGLEVQMTLWGYDFPPDHPLGNTIFKRVRLIYKGTATTPADARIDSMYICQWADPDVGTYTDDLVGCDTTLSLVYGYNGFAVDSTYLQYGLVPPAVGYDLLHGPIVPNPGDTAIFDFQYRPGFRNLTMTSSLWFASEGTDHDPDQGSYSGTLQWYNLMLGLRPRPEYPNGLPWVSPTNDTTVFPLSGDPVTGTGWIDGQALDPGDRRMGFSIGPFTMALGDTQEVVIALIGAIGKDYLNSISVLRETSRFIQDIHDQLFKNLPTRVASNGATTLDDYFLDQNYPNPFNPSTTIRFVLPRASHVTLKIYNILGQEVATLVDERLLAGEHRVRWTPGAKMPAGVYVARLEVSDKTWAMKMVLVR